MIENLRPAFVLVGGLTVLTGIVYPLAMTAIAEGLMPGQARGSLVEIDGRFVGSRLIGQNFVDPKWFHGRPSAIVVADPNDPNRTIEAPYDATTSSGSNLGPLSAKLVERVAKDVEALRGESGVVRLPADAVTTSASGLDPDISPAYARLQVKRIAAARGLAQEKVEALISEKARGRDLGVFGEPRVNVLELNLALAGLGAS